MAQVPRLFVDMPLAPDIDVVLSREHAHYLFGVMRRSVGDEVAVFNGRDGAWLATVSEAGKRTGALTLTSQAQQQRNPPDVWLLFAPIKKARTDFIVEKATEMGVARILPVQTEFTNAERIRQDRLQAHAIEAAEQCGGTYVPEVAELKSLSRTLDDWPTDRQIMFCDEELAGTRRSLPAAPGPWAILIGPEGGFSQDERRRLAGLGNAHAVGLGPRVLRADTAAVAALTVWQQTLGDWQ